MTFEEYQREAVSFRTETANNVEYLTLGLIAEVGEAAGKLAKRRRDDVFDEKAFVKELGDILWFVANLADFYKEKAVQEKIKNSFEWVPFGGKFPASHLTSLAAQAADIVNSSRFNRKGFEQTLCYLGCLANDFGYTLELVAEINLEKLRDRAARGVIQGDGDER